MDSWVILGIIVAIGVFFLCRELMCWYYKINILVALMEEQNNLLKQQLGLNTITGKNDSQLNNSVSNTVVEGEYEVTANTFLRGSPDNDAFEKKPLKVYDKVVMKNTSNDNPDWFYVKTLDGTEGWVYSVYLKKC